MATKKSETAIKKIMKSKGFDKHEIITANPKEIIVALGHSKQRHNELIRHSFEEKSNESLKVDGVLLFDEFVTKVKTPSVSEKSDEEDYLIIKPS